MHRGLTFGLLLGCAAAAAGGPTQETLRAFYFGNSLTDRAAGTEMIGFVDTAPPPRFPGGAAAPLPERGIPVPPFPPHEPLIRPSGLSRRSVSEGGAGGPPDPHPPLAGAASQGITMSVSERRHAFSTGATTSPGAIERPG